MRRSRAIGIVLGLALLAVTLGGCDFIRAVVGRPAPTPIPTLAVAPAFAEADAIAAARPEARALSGDAPQFMTIAAYRAADYCDAGSPCEGTTGAVWVVTFLVRNPDGHWNPAMIVLDGTTGHLLYTEQ